MLEKIESRQEKEMASYIQDYNPGKKFAKIVKKADFFWPWTQARELVTYKDFQQLEISTRYRTLMWLTSDWENITRLGVRTLLMAPLKTFDLSNLTYLYQSHEVRQWMNTM